MEQKLYRDNQPKSSHKDNVFILTPKDNKINQKVLSSKTGNTNYYYIRTSHFNSLNK